MVELRCACRIVAHEGMESASLVSALGFLVDDLAVLWDRIHLNASGRWRNRLCHSLTISLFPTLAIIFRQGEVEVVVCRGSRCLPHSPGDEKLSTLIANAVDVRIVVLTLEVFADRSPLTGGSRVPMYVRVTGARLTNTEFH